jgi:hypothetical protein
MINTLNILNRYQADTICCVWDLYFRIPRKTLRCFKLAYKKTTMTSWTNIALAPPKKIFQR